MRIAFTVIFAILALTLLYCARFARQSRKPMGRPVMHLLLALVPPIIGNLILIISQDQLLSTVGCYIYFIGMDLVMLALASFTCAYCHIEWPKGVRNFVCALLGIDVLQLLANVFTHHAFDIQEIMAYGAPYFQLVPHVGQTFHRIVCYGTLAAVLIVITVKLVRSPRIDSERYGVILATMVLTTIWETLYIFSRAPVDRSMVGFGVFGLLVFYFSLYYRPLRLLDRMLATVASEIPYGLFFFDANGHCIWVNKRAMELASIEQDDLDSVPGRIAALLGSTGEDDESWSGVHITGTGDTMRSYITERRTLTDDKGRTIGSFLTVRDNTNEQKVLQQEIYNATHDGLTKVYNRSGYDLLLSRMDIGSILLLLLDADKFKLINDLHGHEVGDRILQKIARAIEHNFRSDDYVCRIGGDEFVVLMVHAGLSQYELVRGRVERINNELANTADGLPPISVSVGVARGDTASDTAELFEHADQALYATKRSGRRGVTFYGGE